MMKNKLRVEIEAQFVIEQHQGSYRPEYLTLIDTFHTTPTTTPTPTTTTPTP